jgi:NAD(P)-dependent dehydrogenase (short-subunit alcohol dehydrogenase family)
LICFTKAFTTKTQTDDKKLECSLMSESLTSFKDQVVVISGAAQGIGLAAAKLVHERGGHVVLLDVLEEKLQGIKAELALDAEQVHQIDVGNSDSVKSTIAAIEKKYGQIHALINTAGIVGPTNTGTEIIDWADFERTVRINLFGTIWLTQAVLPLMKEKKYGRIVHVTSIAGKEGNPGMSPYNTSKSGMIGYVKGVAKEVAPLGITVNALAPAVISTPMNADTSDETLKYMISRIPMGRVGQAEEVAEMLAFIASRACSYTTGFTFDTSGGRATY